MNVRNCRKCGRLFNYITGAIMCPACREALDTKFKEVKTYIQEHPQVGMKEVSEACDVETAQIQQWIREERLEFTADSLMSVNCESCGCPIRSGRYCDKCKVALTNGLRAAMQRPQTTPQQPASTSKNDSNKMRFLG